MSRLAMGIVVLVVGLISVTAVASTDVFEWIFGSSDFSDGEKPDEVPSAVEAEPRLEETSPGGGEPPEPQEPGNEAEREAAQVTIATPDTLITAPAPSSPLDPGETHLMVSALPKRSEPVVLEGTTVSGLIYVFLTGADVELVEFWLDDPNGSRAPFQTERSAPFDLAGGEVGRADPLNTAGLRDGRHYVTALVTKADGSTSVVTAGFRVIASEEPASSPTATSEDSTTTTPSKATTTKAPKTTTTTSKPKSTTTTTSATKATTTTTKAPKSGGKRSGDVRFGPGDAVASVVAGSPTGTVFVFSPGVYSGVSVQPKAGQKFLGEAGAVLDGNGAKFAFRSGSPNVTVDGLEITDYRPLSRDGVIQAEPGARSWIIQNNHIHHNAEIGVKGTTGWRIIANNVHHNGRYGITSSGVDVLVEGNEIAYNAIDYGATGDSSGTKFVHTEDLVLRSNYVHHNFGNGLWVDINNRGYMIEDNTLVANSRSGIFAEISCSGTIRNNHVEGNGHGDTTPDYMSGSGILVSMSPGVEVYGNTLLNNPGGGIGAIQWNHKNVGAVSKCVPDLKNLNVHHNGITQSGGAAAGIDASKNRDQVWSSWGNTFQNNTYKLSNGARFRWEADWISPDEWAAAGMN